MSVVISILNSPAVKQGTKNAIGIVALGMGGIGLYELCSKKRFSRGFSALCARISLVMTGMITPLGVRLIASVAHRFFSDFQLEKLFGPNVAFEINPWHPRHVVSLLGVVFALPAALQAITSTDSSYLERLALLSILISRPFLHQANRIAHGLFKG